MSSKASVALRSQAEQTAYGPMVVVGVEQHFPSEERLVTDELAAKMLPGPYRAIVGVCRWGRLRSWLIAASEQKAPGIWAAMCGRKRYLDEQVERELGRGVDAVVVLGAGLDGRGARLTSGGRELSVYELDLPCNVAAKDRRLRTHFGQVPDRLALIAVDFETADLGVALERRGFDGVRPAVFLWEGVTQYLTEDGFRQTMAFLNRAAPGSVLAFTYVLKAFIEGRQLHGSSALHRDLVVRRKAWRFGLEPEAVAGVLAQYGWTQREHIGAVEFAERYVKPTGRALPVSEIERCVVAEKT